MHSSFFFSHRKRVIYIIGHGNRDHATSSKRWRSERYISVQVWLRQLCSKTLQAASFGGGFVIPIFQVLAIGWPEECASDSVLAFVFLWYFLQYLTTLPSALMQSQRGSIHSPHNIRNIIIKEWKKSVKFHLKKKMILKYRRSQYYRSALLHKYVANLFTSWAKLRSYKISFFVFVFFVS